MGQVVFTSYVLSLMYSSVVLVGRVYAVFSRLQGGKRPPGRIIAFFGLTNDGLWLHCLPHGAVAQLGERLNGIQEVVGSIPSSSTKDNTGLTR